MNKSEEPSPKTIIGNVKDDALFLLNDETQSNNDEQNEKEVDRKYEKTVLECDKWCSLVKRLVGSNIRVLS